MQDLYYHIKQAWHLNHTIFSVGENSTLAAFDYLGKRLD